MRLVEFDDTINASIMGVLAHLKRKAEGKAGARVRTKSFLKMLQNIGVNVDVQLLNNLRDSNPAIGNLITSVDDESVELNISGETQDDSFDDLDLGDAFDDEEIDDFDLGVDDAGGPTMDDVTEPEMDMNQAAKSQNTVQTMAKKALSRRT